MDTELELLIGGVAATRLAGQFATPLYVYDAEAIRAAFRRIQNAVPYAPRKIHYACVTNSNLAIMRLVRSLGGGIHANTWGGVVIYTGSNIGGEDMLNLFSHRVAANLNSLSQLRNYGAALRRFEATTGGSRGRLTRVGL